jgi:hypothetical protein
MAVQSGCEPSDDAGYRSHSESRRRDLLLANTETGLPGRSETCSTAGPGCRSCGVPGLR